MLHAMERIGMFRNRNIKIKLIILFFISVFSVSLFSYSSPLYSINPWSDANIFLTIGRGMLKGKVMYVDLFDHKGPLLFTLYALCAFISNHSFLGIFIIEIISLFFFLYYSNKIMNLYQTGNHYLAMFAIGFMVCGAKAFSFGGGSVEEFALPVMQGCNFLIIKKMKEKEVFTARDSLMIGFFAAVLFLMKFTICGFFLGIAVSLVIYQFKYGRKTVLHCVLCAMLSFISVNLLVLLYFYINQSVSVYIDSYFVFNLFSYASKDNLLTSMYKAVLAGAFYLKNNPVLVSLSLAGLVSAWFVFKKNNDLKMYLIISFICWYGVSFIGGVFIAYYILPICIWSVLLFLQISRNKSKVPITILCIGTIAASFVLSPNIRHIKDKETVRHSFIDIMNASGEDAEFLMYEGYDEGFYLIAEKIPACRIFTNINTARPDIIQDRDNCVNEKKIDYLISMNKEIDLDSYELIAEEEAPYDDQIRTYRLYKRIDS